MKHLLIILIALLSFSVTSDAQTKVTERIAVPNEAKDTLYVISNMSEMMKGMWNDPSFAKEKPVIIPVKSKQLTHLVNLYAIKKD